MYALNRCGRVQRGLKQERTDCSRETRLLWPWRPGPQGGEDSINRIVCVCLYHKCSGRFPMSVLCESRTFRSSVRSRSVLTQRVTFLYCVSMKLKFQSRFYLLQKHTVVIKATFPGIFCNCWDKKKIYEFIICLKGQQLEGSATQYQHGVDLENQQQKRIVQINKQ